MNKVANGMFLPGRLARFEEFIIEAYPAVRCSLKSHPESRISLRDAISRRGARDAAEKSEIARQTPLARYTFGVKIETKWGFRPDF